MNKNIILFDGTCQLCNRSVQFIIKRDPTGIFKFASLHSEVGKQFIDYYQIPQDIDSLILISQNKYVAKSTAALLICKQLTGIWKFLYIFIIIPRPIRDLAYQIIAKNRYRLFGKHTQCIIPTHDIKKRFL